ncbi:hypothetical protein [Zhihengliuella halotolerans]|uniref:hypothetical protein n=1 Tax=Zhihengliuella halotolerans TaxID=370736 RepID=UPI000C809F9D|nr:hypothetical protein [Zhihengliuella halotolerans]
MQNWVSLIPDRLRLALYLVFGVVSVGIGATGTWYANVDGSVPAWVGGVTAVVVYVGGAFGFVAAGNVSAGPAEILDLDHDDYDVTDPDTGETTTEIGKLGQ